MNLFLAPIQGMTIAAYRNAFSRIFGGIDTYYSPFIATSDMTKVGQTLLKDLFPEHNDAGVKVIPQILSNNGADFRLFASAITDLGYNVINWNIGCPYHTVTKKTKGSGILPYPDMIKSFLEIACADSSYTLTVKMRLGLNSPEEGKRVIEILNQYPLGGVIIHARTGKQMYTGKTDIGSFEELSSSSKHEVTYNGDIFTYEDFNCLTSRFPDINNFMLGRGALQNPFLPSEIKGKVISAENKMKMIRQFHDEIFNHYRNTLSGDKHPCDRMKEFWAFMSIHTVSDSKLIKKINKCHSTTDYINIVNQIFDSSAIWIEKITG